MINYSLRLSGVTRVLILFICIVLGFTAFYYFAKVVALSSNIIEFLINLLIFLVICITAKYFQGMLVFKISLNLKNKTLTLNKTAKKEIINLEDIQEWGYRYVNTQDGGITSQQNLEICLKTGKRLVYPYRFGSMKKDMQLEHLLNESIKISPKAYSTRRFTLQSDVLFITL